MLLKPFFHSIYSYIYTHTHTHTYICYCINRKKLQTKKWAEQQLILLLFLFSVFAIKLLSFTLYPFKILKCSKKTPTKQYPLLPLLLFASSKSGCVCSVYRICLFSFFLLIRLTIENEEVRTGESGMTPSSTSSACCFCSLETKLGGLMNLMFTRFSFSMQDDHMV